MTKSKNESKSTINKNDSKVVGLRANSTIVKHTNFNKLKPKIVFTDYAWRKLMTMVKHAKSEISGYGLLSKDGLVEDFLLPKQEGNDVNTNFDSNEISTLLVEYARKGYQPYQVTRVWIHSHPNMGVTPSGTDWDTFTDNYADSTWAYMVIVNDKGDVSSRYWNKEGNFVIETKVEVLEPEETAEELRWKKEVDEKVSRLQYRVATMGKNNGLWDSNRVQKMYNGLDTYFGGEADGFFTDDELVFDDDKVDLHFNTKIKWETMIVGTMLDVDTTEGHQAIAELLDIKLKGKMLNNNEKKQVRCKVKDLCSRNKKACEIIGSVLDIEDRYTDYGLQLIGKDLTDYKRLSVEFYVWFALTYNLVPTENTVQGISKDEWLLLNLMILVVRYRNNVKVI